MNSYLLFLLLLVYLCTAPAHCRRCPSGTFLSANKACEICPPGTWRQSRDPFRAPDAPCIPCRAGFFSPLAGAVGDDFCRRCTTNTFSDTPGSTSCKPCPPGTSSNFRATKCLRCGPGSAVGRSSKRCVTCNAGSYSSEPTNNKCIPCPLPMTSPRGATSRSQCRYCPPGKSAFRSRCEPCSRFGVFKPGRKGFCESCPPGTFSNEEGATECKQCAPGTFQKGISERKCKPCRPGTTSVGFGNSVCRVKGQPCKKRFFEDSNGDCRACQHGYRLNLPKKKCEKCPPGTVSPGGVQTICELCKNGQIPDRQNTFCGCPKGQLPDRKGGCKPCPASQYNPNDQPTGDTCFSCSPGTFSNKPGATRCKRCPPGQVALPDRISGCIPCPEDTFVVGCISEKTNCPAGFRRQFVGASYSFFGCRRVTCTLDTAKEDIGKKCAPCEPGRFLDSEKKRCRRCPFDEVSSGGIVTECKKCPNGLVQDRYDPSKCSCLVEGKGLRDGICRRCPPGTSSDFENEICVPCLPGTFANKSGMAVCKQCPIDKFSNRDGATRCRKCPEGTISDRRPGGTKCIPIPV